MANSVIISVPLDLPDLRERSILKQIAGAIGAQQPHANQDLASDSDQRGIRSQ